uniref:Uncharacterized protein n=1 Tax=Cacopsylla melanoneura TaxID=428564 RepID=A0A8D8Z7Z7_9HEMI
MSLLNDKIKLENLWLTPLCVVRDDIFIVKWHLKVQPGLVNLGNGLSVANFSLIVRYFSKWFNEMTIDSSGSIESGRGPHLKRRFIMWPFVSFRSIHITYLLYTYYNLRIVFVFFIRIDFKSTTTKNVEWGYIADQNCKQILIYKNELWTL